MLADTWAVLSRCSGTGCRASALEQEANYRTFIWRSRWHMQEDKMVDVQKGASTHWRCEAEKQRGSSSKHPLSTAHRKDNHKVSSSRGVSSQFWICFAALWSLEAPHSLYLLWSWLQAGGWRLGSKGCLTGEWRYLLGCLCWVWHLSSPTLSCR